MKYKQNDFDVETLQQWLDNVLQNETIYYDYAKINKDNEGKWIPLVPTYDYLKMENDEKIDKEYYSLHKGKYFNEHGIGFDQNGNELKREITPDKRDSFSNFNKQNNHDEL